MLSALPAGKQLGFGADQDLDYLRLVHELTGTLSVALLNLDQYNRTGSQASLGRLKANLRLIEDYLNDARQQIKDEREDLPFSVDQALSELVNNFRSLGDSLNVDIEYQNPDNHLLVGSEVRFKQLVSIVIRNALEAYIDQGLDVRKIELSVNTTGDYIVIEVRDYGPGIKKSEQQQIFKPFYSTKPSSSGLGIGLSLVQLSINEDFSGRIELISRPKLGSIFKLYFRLVS